MSSIRTPRSTIQGVQIGKGANVAPTWSTAAGLLTILDETSPVLVRLEAVDFGEALAYSLVGGTLPPGVLLTPEGALTGFAPTVDADTNWTFVVRAADSEGLFADREFSLRVRDVAIPPAFVTAPGLIATVDEGAVFETGVEALDDHDVVTYEVVAGSLPPGVVLDAATGAITGPAPAVAVDLDWTFTVQATDRDGLQSTRAFSLRVRRVNSPPIITTPAGLLGIFNEGDSVSIRFEANDDNGGLGWASGQGALPPGLSLDNAGLLSGVLAPVNQDTTFNFRIAVLDSDGAMDGRDFALVVRNVVRPPVWRLNAGSVGVFSGDATIALDLSATDDAPGVAYAIVDGALPESVTLGADGSLSGIAPRLPQQTDFPFQIVASDADGAQATIAHTLTVRRFNTAPTWVTPPGNLSALGGGQSVDLELEALDDGGDQIVFSLLSGSLPQGLLLLPSGRISGTAPVVSGTVSTAFTVRAADPEGGFAERSFNLIVSPEMDRPPVWNAPPRWTTIRASEGQTFALTLSASDPEGGTISYALDSGTLPSGLTLDAVTGVVSGRLPFVSNNGFHNLGFRATGAAGRFAVRGLTLVIRNDLPQPRWTTNANLGTFNEGTPFSATLAANFAGGAGGSYFVGAQASLPVGITLDAASGVLSGTLPNVGTQDLLTSFVVSARDTADPTNIAARWWALRVRNVPILPVWQTAESLGTYGEGATLTPTTLAASDTEGVPPVLTFSGAWPRGASFNPATGVLSGTLDFLPPSAGERIERQIVATALNTESGVAAFARRTFTIAVLNNNQPPIWQTPAEIGDVFDNATFTATFVASDPEGAPVVLRRRLDLPTGGTFDATTGVLTLVPVRDGRVTKQFLHLEALDTIDPTNITQRSFSWTVRPFVGQPPQWQTPEVLSFGEREVVNFTFVAQPVDGSTVEYAPTTGFSAALPNYFTLSPSGVLTGTTPAVMADTRVTFGVRATTSQRGVATRFFNLTLRDGDTAPVWLEPPAGSLGSFAERGEVAFTFSASSPGGVVWTASPISGGALTGLTMGTSTGVLSGTLPPVVALTNRTFTVRATNARQSNAFAVRTFSLTVLNSDLPPVWQTPAGSVGGFSENTPVLFTLSATDEQQITGYEIVSGNFADSGLSFNTLTGVVSGVTPRVTANASFNFTVRATDDEGDSTTRNFVFSVADSFPVWTNPAGLLGTFVEGASMPVTLVATSPVGIFGYEVTSGTLPEGVELEGLTGRFLGTPYGSVGTFAFTVRASDEDWRIGAMRSTSRSFSLVVRDATLAPAWTLPALANVGTYLEGVGVDYRFDAFVRDDETIVGGSLVAGSVPPGLSVSFASGAFRLSGRIDTTVADGTPTDFAFTMRATDNDGLSADQDFVLRVLPHQPPVWTTPESLGTFREGALFQRTLEALDATSYGVFQALPANLSLSPTTGVLSGSLPLGPTVLHAIPVRAFDSQQAYTDRTFTLTVQALQAPAWATPAGSIGSFDEGAALSFQFAATDADGAVVSYALVGGSLPLGASVTAGGLLAAGSLPLVTADTDFDFTLRATDNDGLFSDRAFALTVADTNDAPIWQTAANLGSFNEGVAVALTFVATDTETVSYSLVGGTLASGLSLSPTGALSGTLAGVAADTATSFIVRASDGVLGTERTFALTVLDVNTPPVWTTPAGSLGSFDEGASVAFTLLATDDKGVAAYSISDGTLPPGLALAPSTGVVSGTLGLVATDTTFSFTARATDTQGVVSDQSLSLTVRNINQAPVWTTPAGNLGIFTAGDAVNLSVVATDDTAVTYSVVDVLPENLTLNASTGAITGNAPNVGFDTTFQFTIRASDGTAFTDRIFSITTQAASNLVVLRSLRRRATGGGSNLNGNLTRAFTTASSNGVGRRLTFSAWTKLASVGQARTFFSGTNASIGFDTGNNVVVQLGTGVFRTFTLGSNGMEDTNAWMHLVVQIDTPNSTADDRVALFVNGVRVNGGGGISQNQNSLFLVNGQTNTVMGAGEMILAEVNVIDNIVVAPTAFGRVNATTGQWEPVSYTGAYNNNGFRLAFTDASTRAALGTDTSGRGNTFTVSGFEVSSSNVFFDSLIDVPGDASAGVTPRGNYSILNARNATSTVMRAAGAEITSSDNQFWMGFASIPARTGKFYFEATVASNAGQSFSATGMRLGVSNSASFAGLGVGTPNGTVPGQFGAVILSGGVAPVADGVAGAASGPVPGAGDVIMVAVDHDAGRVWIGRNGTWLGSGNPATGANPFVNSPAGALVTPFFQLSNTAAWQVNFGARGSFAHTPPSGFGAYTTANLPVPTVASPTSLVGSAAYLGNGAVRAIPLGFQPDVVFIRNRSTVTGVLAADSARGTGIYSLLNSNAAAVTDAQSVTGFAATGVSLGTSAAVNQNGVHFGVFGLRANVGAGIAVVSWIGNGAGARTIAHGLGAAPDAIIMLSNAANTNRVLYHRSAPSAQNQLWTFNAPLTAWSSVATVWNNTAPDATNFTVGSAYNANGVRYAAYVVREVPGFSRVGAYSFSPGTTFWTMDFRPRFLWWAETGTVNFRAVGGILGQINRGPSWRVSALNEAEQGGTVISVSNGVSVADGGSQLQYVVAIGDAPLKLARADR